MPLNELAFEEAGPGVGKKTRQSPRSGETLPEASLAEEIRILRQAKSQLENSPESSLRTLEAYRARFPQGQLIGEAEKLRRLARKALK